jgi:O-antigen ligase
MCGVIALLAVNIALNSLSIKRSSIFYLIAAIACAGLLASFSRGALLAFIIMFFVAILIVRPPLKIWLPPLVVGVIAVILILIFTDIANGFGGRSIALEQREDVWQFALHEVSKHFLIGIGMAKNTYINVPGVDIFNHAHNAWIDTLFRTGVVGLLLSLLSLTVVLKRFSTDRKLVPLYLWLGYGCICRLVDSRCLFWQIDAKWFLYWLPLGLIIASIAAAGHNNSEKENV